MFCTVADVEPSVDAVRCAPKSWVKNLARGDVKKLWVDAGASGAQGTLWVEAGCDEAKLFKSSGGAAAGVAPSFSAMERETFYWGTTRTREAVTETTEEDYYRFWG
eukprot:NODE_6853_length_478_cov_192.130024.p1 GENE.NODE_6853_length_478_cov_192.130024~~NODE_6853_length_478_cov_192.130024.p1  ORF type:complete len:116 (+),score=32.02 NODE_6853_length_478_cov_192.130024:33-350(+)